MSAILGVIRPPGEAVDRDGFQAMLETLRVRGGGETGSILLDDGRVALGQSGGSSRAHDRDGLPPLANSDESIWIVLDGGLDEAAPLREELERSGRQLRGDSHAETILQAYEEWGDACVHRLRGAFAFAIWDSRQARLLAVRDPLGAKPLGIFRDGRGLCFASDPRAFTAHPAFVRELDSAALCQVLAYRCVPGEDSIWRGVSKLRGGHRAVFREGELHQDRYWEPRAEVRLRDFDRAGDELRSAIHGAIRAQIRVGARVGASLAGGLDSTAVSSIASSLCGGVMQTFSYGFAGERNRARERARLAARAFESEPRELDLDGEDLLRLLEEWVELNCEPFWDDAALPTMALGRMARKHDVSLLLSGDGAEEACFAHSRYESYLYQDARSWKRRLRDAAEEGAGRAALGRYFALMGSFDAAAQARLLTSPGDSDHLAWLSRAYRKELPPISALQVLDYETVVIDRLHARLDRAGMSCGVEMRAPFLDVPLVETALSVDPQLQLHAGQPRGLLQRAVSDVVPTWVLHHDDLTARESPLDGWMNRQLSEWGFGLLRDGSLVGRGICTGEGVEALIGAGASKHAWLLLMVELWARRWLEGELPSLLSASRA